MKQLTARDMAQIAIVAAIYIVLTITPPLNAMAYYGYQFRVSEMMNFLAFYNKKYLIAVTLGLCRWRFNLCLLRTWTHSIWSIQKQVLV